MRTATLLAMALAALACAGVRVKTETTPGVDFSALETFAQAPPDEAAPRVKDAVHAEIAKQLEAKGFRPAPHDDADFVVAFRASAYRKARLRNAGDPDATYYRIEKYVAGTLVIDVFPMGSSAPIWHGVGEVDVANERYAERAATRAVRAILQEFPPGSDGGTP